MLVDLKEREKGRREKEREINVRNINWLHAPQLGPNPEPRHVP